MAPTAPPLDQLVAAVEAAVPTVGEAHQGLAVTLYRTLAEGAPVSVATLAERSGVSEQEVAAALRSSAGVYYDGAGQVIGFNGLDLRETAHGLRVDGRQLYTWCAWDPLFIAPLLGREAEVTSICPVTGQPVRLEVGPDGVGAVSPPETVVSFLLPEACADEACRGQNLISSFCHFVLFFASEDAGRQWVSEHSGTFLLSVEEAFELGRRHVRALLGSGS